MKKIYLSLKEVSFSLFFFSLFAGINVYGQGSSICGSVAENFENTSGSMAGFTGDFMLGSNGTNSYLEKKNIIGSGVYTVTTPTYQLPASATFIGFGFTLNGTLTVSRAEIKIMYISTLNNELTTVFLGQFVPAYAPGNTTTDVCRAVSLSDLPGFPTGGQYRFRIELTSNTGGGTAEETLSFDNWSTNGSLALAPLPVDFIGFDAKKGNNTVQLTWQVAGEENVARYEVERSDDGRQFSTIASINTHGKDTYHYTDAVNSSTVYYRIKNVDNDSQFKYSTILRIANGQSQIVLRLFPQPVQHQLTLQHPVIIGRALISLSTAGGRIVRTVLPTNGSMQTSINMSTLPKGMYLLRFDAGNGEVQTLKVIKQ